MSETFFTVPPHWGWLIIGYFFIGGIAGGGILGFFVAGYTGVLLSVTNRPLWADTDLLGLLFLFSAASTAAAALILLGLWRGAAPSVVHWLSQLDSGALCWSYWRWSPSWSHSAPWPASG